MKLPVRIFLALLCAALIVSMPFFLSSPTMLPEAQEEFVDNTRDNNEDDDEDGEIDFGRLLFSAAYAEDELVAEDIEQDGKLSIPDEWALPFDFSMPPAPDPDKFTENGYEDQSIRVRLETREMFDSIIQIAFVEIADPSQLRTATAAGLNSVKASRIETIARNNNAVIAMNGDMFIQDVKMKKFEVRMTEFVTYEMKRSKSSDKYDVLIIDKDGNFHLFLRCKGMSDYMNEHQDEVVNAYMFGPALIKDGSKVELKADYGYAATHKNPRSAIGQTGPLSYAMVVVKGRSSDSKGVTHYELADIMQEIGCVQAYNLDGGNSARLLMIGPDSEKPMMNFIGQNVGRGHSDIIYFATAVPEEERR